jgi:hypothetical protein
MIANQKPRVVFEGGFDEREAMESKDRGYRSHVWAELGDGERYPLVFYDAVRLQQDLDNEARAGSPYIAETGLIVLQEVTKENMELAVARLVDEGYFESLKPVGASTGADER